MSGQEWDIRKTHESWRGHRHERKGGGIGRGGSDDGTQGFQAGMEPNSY